jgi:hypothetical protein
MNLNSIKFFSALCFILFITTFLLIKQYTVIYFGCYPSTICIESGMPVGAIASFSMYLSENIKLIYWITFVSSPKNGTDLN